ncbi:YicC family protein [Aliiroseovarius crassostreae]|uniref:YicC/YloC family endoribonuclease n=1 Tax=Aliiroseovarius crassostreae TaxID=154981 RepID=UPI0021FA33B5|nr:YicC/YloC family endoribonuclease [Aliiroseovarius crassostreae]UWQ02903.1 YicC family protein [Aliiroseovarius crassostreae]
MAQSMTGFASATGDNGTYSWNWDIRSVNARGLDLRLRLPDWIPGLDEAIRKALKGHVTRGNISLGLRVSRGEEGGQAAISPTGLAQALGLLGTIRAEAENRGLPVAPVSPSDIATMRGVLEVKSGGEEEAGELMNALSAQIPDLVRQFVDAREGEGAELVAILSAQLDEVAQLVDQAELLLSERQEAQKAQLGDAMARVLDNTDGLEPDRIIQELALIAVKSDVREEVDRLRAHVSAAREHLASSVPMGRKLDFLMQEFNREANTLCSKAQFNALTTVGLDLKHVIDQMREQVQNLE